MKPKTRIQKEVARLSANLHPISATQIDWAYRHCVEHIGYRTKKGNITCSDCGHEWHSNSGLCDSLDGCTCPQCRAELKVRDTRKRTHKETRYFSVITTCKGYQLIRVAQVRCESRKGEPMKFYCHEVVQRWISPKGIITDMDCSFSSTPLFPAQRRFSASQFTAKCGLLSMMRFAPERAFQPEF